jgi:delta24-sterol reductase
MPVVHKTPFLSQTFEREVNKRTCNEFVECLVYSKSKAVVMTGNFTDSANPGMLNEIGIWHKPWFFKHVEEKLECNGLSTEFIPIRDYYHRHSRYLIN